MILASHILHEVEAVNLSLLLISGGRLLASGSPEEVRSILTHCPNAIRIRTSDNRLLASEIIRFKGVQNVMFEEEQDTLIVSTVDTGNFLRAIPKVIERLGLKIFEIRQADESLQDIFFTLMQIHRGELQRTTSSNNGLISNSTVNQDAAT